MIYMKMSGSLSAWLSEVGAGCERYAASLEASGYTTVESLSGLDDAGLQSLGVSDSSYRRIILDSMAHSGLEGDTESGQMSADLFSFMEDLDTITGNVDSDPETDFVPAPPSPTPQLPSHTSAHLQVATKPRPHSPASQGGDADSTTLHLLSWNIDGLDANFTVIRARAVCDVIQARKPEVVYLQEIVESTWQMFSKTLGSTYFLYRNEETAHMWRYYCIMLVRKGSAVLPESEKAEIMRFPQSRQNRYLIQLRVVFSETIPILLLTSHLESLMHNARERKKQLKTSFLIMDEALRGDSGARISILGGDLNLVDRELAQIGGLPPNLCDAWEHCGSELDQKYTWDSTEPHLRLDRVVFSRLPDSTLVPTLFELVGREALSACGGMHPSDHLGMWAEFQLRSLGRVEETTVPHVHSTL